MSKVIHEDVTETAKKIRKYLKQQYPQLKFSVRVERFAGGDAVRVALKDPSHDFEEAYAFDGKIKVELKERFSSYESDAMRDCMVEGYYEYEGKKYRGSMFITVQS